MREPQHGLSPRVRGNRFQEAFLWMAGIVVGTTCAAAMLLVMDHIAPFDSPRPASATIPAPSTCR